MKTLAGYISDYKSTKTRKGRRKIFNKAMLNLSYSDQHLFLKQAIQIMNEEYESFIELKPYYDVEPVILN